MLTQSHAFHRRDSLEREEELEEEEEEEEALDSRQEESQLSLTNPMASLLFAGLLAGAVAADIPLAFFGR
ncbi:hypothetical protein AK812_SmicGene35026 [Symbiodinium microadriaticum]|uniref:Uncharacterized protein n=1 Tax=Symbiodinium microadriaticum TaxID=2951 RepID=A0A1Q9CMI8_SYMMI|nr:hypothetical protein AK812_SmicGene35026 [Symbiodinium microadriaticum]